MILYKGNIITMDGTNPKAEATGITGNRVVFVGKNGEVFDLKNSKAEIIDLNGKTVCPDLTTATCIC